MRFPRRRTEQQPSPPPGVAQAPWPVPTAGPMSSSPGAQVRPAPDPVRYDVAESAPLATTPMPYDVAADHEPVIVFAAGFRQVADLGGDPGSLLKEILEALGRDASERGCDAVYGVHHTLAVDHGWMYITAMGTGSRPTPNLDGPPAGR